MCIEFVKTSFQINLDPLRIKLDELYGVILCFPKVYFYVLKRVPIYFSCSEFCCESPERFCGLQNLTIQLLALMWGDND